jgi:diguanylate cyclase (GGDEF)-like protein
MNTIVSTYPDTSSTNFTALVSSMNYSNNMGQLTFYPSYQVSSYLNNFESSENTKNTEQDIVREDEEYAEENGDMEEETEEDADMEEATEEDADMEEATENNGDTEEADSTDSDSGQTGYLTATGDSRENIESLINGNAYYGFYYGDDGYYIRIALPVFYKNEFEGLLLCGYSGYRYTNLLNYSSYYGEASAMLVDRSSGFCILDQNDNKNCNLFDYLDTVEFSKGSLTALKKDFLEGSYGFVRFYDPADDREYYMTYDKLEIANQFVCNLIPCSCVEQQVATLSASSDDLIIVIFSVIFIMIILIFIVQTITTIRIRNNQNRLQLEQNRFHTVMNYTQSAIWEYKIKQKTMEKPDNNIGINVGSAIVPDFEHTALKKNAIYEEDIPAFRTFCKELSMGKPNISAELRARDSKGCFVWFSMVGTTIFDSKGNPVSVIGQTTNIDHEKQEMENLKNLSERDPLTKLYNRETAQKLIDNVLKHSDEHDIHAFCMIDVDNFKSVNDTYGHIFGDAVLTEISSKLKAAFEKEHIASRYGGDEFIVFIKYAPSIEYIEEKAQLINELLKEIYVGDNSERHITTSVGIAIYPGAGTTRKTLMKHADIALYYSKNAGKSCYHIYNEAMQQKGSVIEEKETTSLKDQELHQNKHIKWSNVDTELVAQVVDFLFDARDLRSSLNMILSLVGSTFHLSRISIEEYSYDQVYASLTYDWINPLQKVRAVAYKNRTVKEADETNYYKMVPNGIFYTNDVFSMDYEIPEKLIPVFKQINLKCMYQCGFAENGVYHGSIQAVIHDDKDREWTPKEISTLTIISKIIGGYLLKIHSQEHAKSIEELDILTGAYNFFKFISVADAIISQSDEKHYLLAYTDIDMFKYINTTYGYSEGDHVLKQFAEIIKKHLEPEEIFCRVTADKFIILMNYESRERTVGRIKRLMKSWHQIKTLQGGSHKLTVKAGLCVTNSSDTATLAIDQANIARQSIHESHKSVYVFFDESMKSTLVKQKEIEDVMDEALVNEEFLVYYQPKFNLSTDEVCGAEALVRWKRPDVGLIPPNEFIPIFEDNEFIVELDFYMLRKVCMQIRELLDKGKHVFPISVNFSPVHLRDQDFVLKMTNIVDSCQVPRKYIEVELTESAMFEDNNYLLTTLNTLHELGFRLSMDDFGSGYSSLNLLRILPFDVIKLDKEFFHHGSTTQREQIIISNVITMLKELDMQIVAEGVETEEQAQFLKTLECNIAQGFLYERPLPAEEFLRKYFQM